MLDLRPMLYAMAFVGALAIAFLWGITALLSSDSIESKTPIKPTIRYTLTDNRLDSVYVYSPPKTGFLHRIFSKYKG